MRILVLVLLLTYTSQLKSQNARYVLVEHFTNTWCPICASRNPSLQDLLIKYPKNVHHISIHPPYPYSGCPLYQYNKIDNQDRATFYNIFGSPSVVLNGGGILGGSPLVTEDALKKEIARTSPLSVLVTESGSGNNRSATVTIKSSGAINGDLRLVVILVERNLRFTASNGELDHYNVMRKYLTTAVGQKITITDATEKKYVYAFKDSTGWKPEELYVMAFVQNFSTKEVFNSGTKFDLTTSIFGSFQTLSLKVYPTVARDLLFIDSPTSNPADWDIINTQGQVMIKGTALYNRSTAIAVNVLPPGVYFIKMKDSNKIYTAKFIKQ